MYLFKNILHIDDDPDELAIVGRAIRQLSPDMKVTTADNALYGLAQIKALPDIDLIFVDLNMPGMDGFQYLEALRMEPDYKNTPCIVWTSSNNPELRTRAIALGAVGFNIKPTSSDKLKKMLDQIFKGDLSV